MSRKRHEAPRKVSSKTESFGWILKILSRKRHEKYNACIGEIPTLKTNFFCLDPRNICSRSTTQSFVQNEVVWSGLKNNGSKASRSTMQSFVQNGVVWLDSKNTESEATRKVQRLYRGNPDPDNQFFLSGSS